MTIRVAINGYGRIGRMILRAHYEYGKKHDIEIVAINDLLAFGEEYLDGDGDDPSTFKPDENIGLLLGGPRRVLDIDGDTVVVGEGNDSRTPSRSSSCAIGSSTTDAELKTSSARCAGPPRSPVPRSPVPRSPAR